MTELPPSITHRGRPVLLKYHKLLSGSFRHPPNSLAALAEVLAGGAEALEIDLRLAADGRFVLLHDETLERETSGVGPVRKIDSAAFRALRLRGGEEPGAGFDELIERILGVERPIKLQLDLKEALPLDDAATETLALAIERLGANPNLHVVVGCLADWNLRALRRRLPWLAVGIDPAFHLDAPVEAETRLPTRVNAYGYLDDHPLGFYRLLPVARYLEDRFDTLLGLVPEPAEVYLRKDLLAQALADGFDPIAHIRRRLPGCLIDVWTIDPKTDAECDLLRLALDAGADQITTNMAMQIAGVR